MKRKIFISILICALASFSIFSCGCGVVLAVNSSSNYLYGKNFDGQIVEQIVVPVEATYSPQEKQNIKWTARDIINQRLTTYKANIQSQLSLPFSAEYKDALSQMMNAVQISWPEWDEDTDEFFVQIVFENETSYLWFYNVVEKNFKQTSTTKQWLYYTIHYTGSSNYIKSVGLYGLLSDSISLATIFPEILDSQLTYSYLTQSGRYHSNADTTKHATDGYVHTWNVTDEDRVIEFSLNIAKRQNWYILAIIIGLSCTLVLGIVALVVVLIKHNKRKRLIYRIISH